MKKLAFAVLSAGLALALVSAPAVADTKQVAVIIKATNSEFWQFVLWAPAITPKSIRTSSP